MLKCAFPLLVAFFFNVMILPAVSAFGKTAPSESCTWTDIKDTGATLDDSQKKALLEYALSNLSVPEKTGEAPPSLQADETCRILFISVSDGRKPAIIARGEGMSLATALDAALIALRKEAGGGLPKPEWIKIDVVSEVRVDRKKPVTSPLPVTRGLWGLAFTPDEKLTFLPEIVAISGMIDAKGYLQAQELLSWGDPSAKDLVRSILAEKTADYIAFRTESFFTDGTRFINLYRGAPESLDPTEYELMEASSEAANFLARSVDRKGRFVYLYDPVNDTSLGGYNILRHAGALFAMLEYYRTTGDREILKASQRALEYLVSKTKTLKKNGIEMACVVEGGNVKLGGNGLAALALASFIEVTGDRTHLPLLLKIGTWMLSVQDKTGNFTVHKQRFPDGPVSDFRSLYYPGEAIFGLMRIYALDQRPEWLAGAAAAARYLINVRDKGLKDHELSHDHWLLYGLAELYQTRRESLFLEHGMRIAGAIIRAQNINARFPDWNGGFSSNPRSTPAATRMEGLGAAYAIASSAGRNAEAEIIFASLRLGAGFLLRTIISPSLAMYMKNPPGALGGVRESLTGFQVRIDYPQHSLSAFLAIASIMEERR